MLETGVLLGFTLILLVGMFLKFELYVSLFFGFLLFSGYGLYKGYSIKELARMSTKGVKTVGPILLLFVLIGMLTASWRAAGTIPYITTLSSEIISPSTLVILTFVLSSIMGFITGSAFATSATIGVICMTIGSAMGANLALLGGAMLSGCFFGDRTSPVSGSSNLVATLTQTNLFNNLSRMLRTALIPVLLCGLIFWIAGLQVSSNIATIDFASHFKGFDLTWYVLTPTLVIVMLSLCKVNVKISMAASLTLALALCVFVQGMPVAQIPSLLLFGYHSTNFEVASMINGGGIVSMIHISLIIVIASTYSGLFEGTGLLNGLHNAIVKLSRHTTPYTGILATSMITTGVACDQTLSIMLTHQLCDEVEGSDDALALDILNSSSFMCALMPWTTSCMGCLAFTGASPLSCLFAFFPIIMPLWFMFLSWHNKKNPLFVDGKSGQLLGFTELDDVRRCGLKAA